MEQNQIDKQATNLKMKGNCISVYRTDMDIYLESLEPLDFSKVKCGIKTLQGYITAICDLYNFQNQFENNTCRIQETH